MPGGKPVPAAQYLRTSMPQHECSIAYQREAINNYAKRNGFRIVRTYVDAGKSGVNLKQRPSFKSLLRDVNSGQADFKAILTYDISRWGRFQDTDEPASYEFMCKRAGIIVRYCAEEFSNDESVSSSTMKILKRMMAAEYSRELSVKVYAGQRRLAKLGFMVGGTAPYGLRRLALSPDGRAIREMLRGNWKGSTRSHVVLVPGPGAEVECVRHIFAMASDEQKTGSQIASELNSKVFKSPTKTWTAGTVNQILANPVYAGYGVWGRTTQKIRGGRKKLPRSQWIVKPDCYAPIIDPKTFERVRGIMAERRPHLANDEELLQKLALLLEKKGRLSSLIINAEPGFPARNTYARHFGTLANAYERIGYRTSGRPVNSAQHSDEMRRLRKQLLQHLRNLLPGILTIKRDRGTSTEILEVDGHIKISLFLCREILSQARNRRWVFRLREAERCNLALIGLVDRSRRRIQAFHLLPPLDTHRACSMSFQENDPRLVTGTKLTTLKDLCSIARRTADENKNIAKKHMTRSPSPSAGATFEFRDDARGGKLVSRDETPPQTLIPVAQYVRMSTDRQENSTESQKDAIARFAVRHGMRIVHTYEDLGKSGLLLKRRPGLRRLVQDVVAGQASFKAILVFDVSRWGRFQDPDESAHYEFLCRSCGIPIVYCGELFSNETTLQNSALKAMKRAMAAEFSRELSDKVVEAAKKVVELGYRLGGMPGLGYRRVTVTADGRQQRQLEFGERKDLENDRVILVPGPASEVSLIQRIFHEVIKSRKSCAEIARELNRDGLTPSGVPWTHDRVYKLLTNPKYAGHNVWNRSSGRLGAKRVRVPPEQWIKKVDAFAPIVTPAIFDRAQERRRTWADRVWSDEEIIRSLQRLLRAKGRLTERLLKKTSAMPHQDNLRRRFGSVRNTWRLAGYELPKQYRMSGVKFANGQQLRREFLEGIVNMFPDRVKTFRLSGHLRRLLRVDEDIVVSILCCRRERTSYGKLRWMVIPIARERDFTTLVCLLNRTNNKVCRFYLFPRIDIRGSHRIEEKDRWLAQGIRLRRLTEFCDIVQSCQQNR